MTLISQIQQSPLNIVVVPLGYSMVYRRALFMYLLLKMVLVTFSHSNFAVPSQYPTLPKFIFVIANKRLTVLLGCSNDIPTYVA